MDILEVPDAVGVDGSQGTAVLVCAHGVVEAFAVLGMTGIVAVVAQGAAAPLSCVLRAEGALEVVAL